MEGLRRERVRGRETKVEGEWNEGEREDMEEVWRRERRGVGG